MSRRKKGLSDDEAELWSKVIETAKPLHSPSKLRVLADPKKPVPKTKTHHPITPFQLGQMVQATTPSHNLAPSLTERVNAAPLRMDRKSFTKMKRGKLRPEGKLDLHGMTLAAAHPAMVRFLMDAYEDGKRLVLVVTGKGKVKDEGGPIPIRRGVLKHQVPQWLSMPPLGSIVLQVTEAHQSHGGGGAYYVYLKRTR